MLKNVDFEPPLHILGGAAFCSGTMPQMDPLPHVRATDEDLLSAHLAGDALAFPELWARHRRTMLAYATRMLGTAEEAEEIVHEAFLRAADGRWQPEGALRAWLLTVVHRLCLDALRRRRRWLGVADRLRRTVAVFSSQETQVLRTERERRLAAAIESLPDEHRAVVWLYYAQELPSKEVAAIVGCDDGQVRSRLSYARTRLRHLLTAEDEP